MLKCQIWLLEDYLIISLNSEDDDIREALNEVFDAVPSIVILGSYPETQP